MAAHDLQSVVQLLEASLDPSRQKKGKRSLLVPASWRFLLIHSSGECNPSSRAGTWLFAPLTSDRRFAGFSQQRSARERPVFQELCEEKLGSQSGL